MADAHRVAELIVLEGGGEGGDAPITLRPPDPNRPYCSHRNTEVDVTARKVTCRSCEMELDAFDALTALARDHDRWWRMRQDLKRQCEAVAEELRELKRQRTNLKAQVKRLRAKAG